MSYLPLLRQKEMSRGLEIKKKHLCLHSDAVRRHVFFIVSTWLSTFSF